MPSRPPLLRFLLALTISLLLHAAVIVEVEQLIRPRPEEITPAALQARLVPPLNPVTKPAITEPLLKNTLTDAESGRTPPPPTFAHPLRTPRSRAASRSAARELAARRKLSEHLFYPPQAVAQGLEGEVRLLLTLDQEGKVLTAEVASSSGHAVLDRAAVNAAYAMHRLPGAGVREMVLPVVFKLQ